MYKTKFEEWLRKEGRSNKTIDHYSGAIKVKLSILAKETGIFEENLFSIAEREEFDKISEELRALPEFVEFDSVGNRMYSAALNRYSEFLKDVDVSFLGELEEVMEDKDIDNTTRQSLVQSRIGQGRFRKELKAYWGGCAVTGISSFELLIASHIKPWRDSTNPERLDRYNGLLLQPNLDRLFDRGYVTFDLTGDMKISEQHKVESETLGADTSMCLSKIEDEHKSYLRFHQENIFEIDY